MTAATCPVCMSPNTAAHLPRARDYITGDLFTVQRCDACGLGFTLPQPDNMDPYYPARYRRYAAPAMVVLKALYRWRVRSWAKALPRPGLALELGCGDGYMLDALRRRGWRVVGVERSEQAAAFGRSELGLEIHAGGLEALPDKSRFDLIVLFQVLEHMPDPLTTLRQCAELLTPGGVLVIAVPNFASWQARSCGADWLHLDVPRHLSHFSPASIAEALRLANLQTSALRFVSVEHDPYGWVQSLLNQMGFRQNWLTRILMKLDRPTAGAVGMGLVAALLTVPSLVMAMVSWVARAGAIMEVRARKSE